MPKAKAPKNLKISFLKCSRCRRDRKKCTPISRDWSKKERCDRCVANGFTCSDNVTKAKDPKTTPLGATVGDAEEIAERTPIRLTKELLEELDLLIYLRHYRHALNTGLGDYTKRLLRCALRDFDDSIENCVSKALREAEAAVESLMHRNQNCAAGLLIHLQAQLLDSEADFGSRFTASSDNHCEVTKRLKYQSIEIDFRHGLLFSVAQRLVSWICDTLQGKGAEERKELEKRLVEIYHSILEKAPKTIFRLGIGISFGMERLFSPLLHLFEYAGGSLGCRSLLEHLCQVFANTLNWTNIALETVFHVIGRQNLHAISEGIEIPPSALSFTDILGRSMSMWYIRNKHFGAKRTLLFRETLFIQRFAIFEIDLKKTTSEFENFARAPQNPDEWSLSPDLTDILPEVRELQQLFKNSGQIRNYTASLVNILGIVCSMRTHGAVVLLEFFRREKTLDSRQFLYRPSSYALTPVQVAVLSHSLDVLKMLCENGLQLDVDLHYGNNGLLDALATGWEEGAELLLEHGARLSRQEVLWYMGKDQRSSGMSRFLGWIFAAFGFRMLQKLLERFDAILEYQDLVQIFSGSGTLWARALWLVLVQCLQNSHLSAQCKTLHASALAATMMCLECSGPSVTGEASS